MNQFKRIIAVLAAVTMVISGIALSPAKSVQAAGTDSSMTVGEASIGKWSFYQSGTSTNAYNHYELCAFSNVDFGNSVASLTSSSFTHNKPSNKPQSVSDEKYVTAKGASSSFSATIESNGFSGTYTGTTLTGNNPSNLYAYVPVTATKSGKNTISFRSSIASGAKTGTGTSGKRVASSHKYATVAVIRGNSPTGDQYLAVKDINITTSATTNSITYNCEAGEKVTLKIMVGAFMYVDGKVITSKEFDWTGTVMFSSLNVSNGGEIEIAKPNVPDSSESSRVDTGTVQIAPWSFYQTGTSTDYYNPYEICAFSGVSFQNGAATSLAQSSFSHRAGYLGVEPLDVKTVTSNKGATGFTAGIESNGWGATYTGSTITGNNPSNLQAITKIYTKKKGKYIYKFQGSADSTKYALILIENAGGNTIASETVKLTSSPNTISVPFYSTGANTEYKVIIMLGAFMYKEGVVTTEDKNWTGNVNIKSMQFVEDGDEEIATTTVNGSAGGPASYAVTDATIYPWTFFQTGTSTNHIGPYELCAYSGVTFADTSVPALPKSLFSHNEPKAGYHANPDKKLVKAGGASNGFNASIESNGWSADYEDGVLVSNAPYTVTADTKIKVDKTGKQTASFKAYIDSNATADGKAVDCKYAKLVVTQGENYLAVKTIKITTSNKTFSVDFFAAAGDEVNFEIMLGAFMKEDDVVTSPESSWAGKVHVTSFDVKNSAGPTVPSPDVASPTSSQMISAGAANLGPWSFYQTGTSTDYYNSFELCAFNGVSFTTSGANALTQSQFSHYEPYLGFGTMDAKTVTSNKGSTGFAAGIESNGWSASFDNGEISGNNPSNLQAIAKFKVNKAGKHTLQYTVKGSKAKYATVMIADGDNAAAVETIKLTTSNQTKTLSFFATSADKEYSLKIMLGAFLYKEGVVTTDEKNWTGTVNVTNISFIKEQDKEIETIEVNGTAGGPATVAAGNATMSPWEFFQTGTSTNGYSPYELSAFQGVTFPNSQVPALAASLFSHNEPMAGYHETDDQKNVKAGGASAEFKATIESNGYAAEYEGDQIVGNLPYELTASTNLTLSEAGKQTAEFTAYVSSGGTVDGSPSNVKYATVLAKRSNGDILASKTIKLTTTPTKYSLSFSGGAGETVTFTMMLGAFMYKDGSVVTSLEKNYSGVVNFSGMKVSTSDMPDVPGPQDPEVTDDQMYDATTALIGPWTFYQTGTSTDVFNPYELCAFNGVTFSNYVSKLDASKFSHNEPYSGMGTMDAKTVQSAKGSTGFTAGIESNGFSGTYEDLVLVDNNPSNLQAFSKVIIKKAAKYTYKFVGSVASGNANKYVTVMINSGDNTVAVQTYKLTTTATTYELPFFAAKDNGEYTVKFMLGSFLKTNDVVTDVDQNWTGSVSIKNMQFVKGENADPDPIDVNGTAGGPATLSAGTATIEPWVFFQTGTSTNYHSPYELSAFEKVTFNGTSVPTLAQSLFSHNTPMAGYQEVNDKKNVKAGGASKSFEATIESNGYAAEYDDNGNAAANIPYELTASTAMTLTKTGKQTVSLSADAINSMVDGAAAGQKYATLAIKKEINGEEVIIASKDIKLTSTSQNYDIQFYGSKDDKVTFTLMLGAFMYEDGKVVTSTEKNYSGTVRIKNFSVSTTDMPEDPAPEINDVTADKQLDTGVVKIDPWSFYQTGTSTDYYNSYELCAFKGVTFQNNATNLAASAFSHKEPYAGIQDFDYKTVQADKGSTGFTATIESNGWGGTFENGELVGNNPSNVQAITRITTNESGKHTFKFAGSATSAKYATVIIESNGNPIATETFKLTTNSTNYEVPFYAPTAGGQYDVKIMLGAFMFKDEVVTEIEKEWSGKVNILNMVFVKEEDEEVPTEEISGTAGGPSTVSIGAGTLKPWAFFQTGTSTDTVNAWDLAAFQGVTFTDTTVPALQQSLFSHNQPTAGYTGVYDQKLVTAGGASAGFTADIESNGFAAQYDATGNVNGNAPYELEAMAKLNISQEGKHTLKFTGETATGKTREKYMTVSVKYNDNTIASKTYELTNSKRNFELTFLAPAAGDGYEVSIMLGAYMFVDDVVTNVEKEWYGKVSLSKLSLVKESDDEDDPEVEVITKPSSGPSTVSVGDANLGKWEFYQTGTSTDYYNAYELCAFSKVDFANNVTDLTADDFSHFAPVAGYPDGGSDAKIVKAGGAAKAMQIGIEANGFAAQYDDETGDVKDNLPSNLTASADFTVNSPGTYKFEITDRVLAGATIDGKATTDKYIQVTIEDENFADTKLFKVTGTSTTHSITFKKLSTVASTVTIELGAFMYVDGAYVQAKELNWNGTLDISNIQITKIGEEETTEAEITTTTTKPVTTTKKPTTTTTKPVTTTKKTTTTKPTTTKVPESTTPVDGIGNVKMDKKTGVWSYELNPDFTVKTITYKLYKNNTLVKSGTLRGDIREFDLSDAMEPGEMYKIYIAVTGTNREKQSITSDDFLYDPNAAQEETPSVQPTTKPVTTTTKPVTTTTKPVTTTTKPVTTTTKPVVTTTKPVATTTKPVVTTTKPVVTTTPIPTTTATPDFDGIGNIALDPITGVWSYQLNPEFTVKTITYKLYLGSTLMKSASIKEDVRTIDLSEYMEVGKTYAIYLLIRGENGERYSTTSDFFTYTGADGNLSSAKKSLTMNVNNKSLALHNFTR